MRFPGWRLGACALLACTVGACSSSSGTTPPAADASTGDATPPPIKDSGSPVDSSMQSDSGSTDASDGGASADGATDASDDGPDDGGCAWTGTYESPACSTCLRTVCCSTTNACETDPACVALDMCIGNCLTTGGEDSGVADCSQACFDSQPVTVRNEWQGLNDCIAYSCNDGGSGPCQ